MNEGETVDTETPYYFTVEEKPVKVTVDEEGDGEVVQPTDEVLIHIIESFYEHPYAETDKKTIYKDTRIAD